MNGAELIRAKWTNARVEHSSLVSADFAGSDFENARFTDCDLSRSNWKGASLGGALFDRCVLREVSLPNVHPQQLQFYIQ